MKERTHAVARRQANETCGTRVSIDFRVLPLHLHVPPRSRDPHATSMMQNQYVLDEGAYYNVARTAGMHPSLNLPPLTGSNISPDLRTPEAVETSVVMTLQATSKGQSGAPSHVKVTLVLTTKHMARRRTQRRPPAGCACLEYM